jgi:hypothetical protein
MSIYEILGTFYLVFTCAAGHAAIIWLALAGGNRIKQRLSYGESYETVIKDHYLNNDIRISLR